MALATVTATLYGTSPGISQDICRTPTWHYYDLEQPDILPNTEWTETKLADIPEGTVVHDVHLTLLRANTTGVTTLTMKLIDTGTSPVTTDLITGVVATSGLIEKTNADGLIIAAGVAIFPVATGYVMPTVVNAAGSTVDATAALYARATQSSANSAEGCRWRIGVLMSRYIRP